MPVMKTITAEEFLSVKGKSRLAVDVRSPDEFRFEHVEGSINIPLERLKEGLAELPPNENVYLICQSGLRSIAACERLELEGFSGVTSVQGGIGAIKKAGGVIEKSGAPLPLMRQVQIAAGSLVVLGVILSYMIDPKWILISAFVGLGLVLAGVTGSCVLALLLSKMPWNKINQKEQA